MTAPQHSIEANSKKNRSQVTNGKSLFGPDVDHRSASARRAKDLIEDLSAQIGGDPSPAQEIIIRNASMLAALCEEDHRKMINGESVEHEQYLKRVTTLANLLGKIGLKRLARDISPKAQGVELHGHAAVIRGGAARG